MSRKLVTYRGYQHVVLFKYDSGYCEIRRVNYKSYYDVILVHKSELDFVS